MNRLLVLLLAAFVVAAMFGLMSARVLGATDTTPPTILGMWVTQNGNGSNFRLMVDVVDDVGVAHVEVYLDGVLVVTPTQQAWPVLIRIRGAWAHTVGVLVFDAAGNEAYGSYSVVGR